MDGGRTGRPPSAPPVSRLALPSSGTGTAAARRVSKVSDGRADRALNLVSGAVDRPMRRGPRRHGVMPAIMHRQPGGVAHGDEQDHNHSSGIAPTGLAVERNEIDLRFGKPKYRSATRCFAPLVMAGSRQQRHLGERRKTRRVAGGAVLSTHCRRRSRSRRVPAYATS